MTGTRPPRRYSSGEASVLSGATYRQVDYWERNGMLGPRQAKANGRPGSGWRRGFSFPEIVLMRAYIRAADIGQVRWAEKDAQANIWQPIIDAYCLDEKLKNLLLIVEGEGRASIAYATSAPAALIVNLAVCAREVRRRESRLVWATTPRSRAVAAAAK